MHATDQAAAAGAMPEEDGVIFRLPPYKINSVLSASDVGQTIDWGLTAYGVPAAQLATRGKGVRVAILDTGVDDTHPDLAGQIAGLKDFTGSSVGTADVVGHGTHCAGNIAAINNLIGVLGVAPACSLHVYKVLGDDGSGMDSWVAAGIRQAIADKCHVISMSLGSPFGSSAIHAAIQAAYDAGIYVVTAAGNSGPRAPIDFPARWNLSLAVASINKAGAISGFSSHGEEMDFAAPGEEILSTYPGGRYARMSGTSMATPFLAGIVALALSRSIENTGAANIGKLADLILLLKRSAIAVGAADHSASGWGVIDVRKLVDDEAIKPAPKPPTLPPVLPVLPPVSGVRVLCPNGGALTWSQMAGGLVFSFPTGKVVV